MRLHLVLLDLDRVLLCDARRLQVLGMLRQLLLLVVACGVLGMRARRSLRTFVGRDALSKGQSVGVVFGVLVRVGVDGGCAFLRAGARARTFLLLVAPFVALIAALLERLGIELFLPLLAGEAG